ncbi:MAG: bacillithiol transferase BstA [Bacteroidetes bacterium]|nr:bacillithiol transferase BstA [Bacteroidota bacterium]
MATDHVNQLRYPIGQFDKAPKYSLNERQKHIEILRTLPELIRKSVSGLRTPQLDTPYRDGGWRVRQVVHHLADSHMNGFIRHRLALTEEEPTIRPYIESAWSELPDAEADVSLSLTLLEGLHQRWSTMLDRLTAEQFERTYIHPESGKWTLEQSVANYAWHSLHHVAHITSLRTRNGW